MRKVSVQCSATKINKYMPCPCRDRQQVCFDPPPLQHILTISSLCLLCLAFRSKDTVTYWCLGVGPALSHGVRRKSWALCKLWKESNMGRLFSFWVGWSGQVSLKWWSEEKVSINRWGRAKRICCFTLHAQSTGFLYSKLQTQIVICLG